MKRFYKYIFVLVGLLSLASCSEEKVDLFSSELGVNFQHKFSDPKINFYPLYAQQGMDMTKKDVVVKVQLEGALSNQATSILLKTEPFEDFEQPNIVLPGDSAIEAGEYKRDITISCMKPDTFGKVYKSILTFDYENSDVVPGILEEQTRVITVSDETVWGDMNVDSEEAWNQSYSNVLGKYGDVKVRFIMAAMGQMGHSYQKIKQTYQYTLQYPSYGFPRYIKDIQKALDEYNASHKTPLCEADGTPVSFN